MVSSSLAHKTKRAGDLGISQSTFHYPQATQGSYGHHPESIGEGAEGMDGLLKQIDEHGLGHIHHFANSDSLRGSPTLLG